MSDATSTQGRRCVVCKTGVLEGGHKTATFERDSTTIVLKQVPGLICTTCGEGYFSEEVTDRLLQLVEDVAAAGVGVGVRRFTTDDLESGSSNQPA